MRLLPRNLYFRYGRVRLYRRLYACAKVLALIAAGAVGIVYLNRPEMIQLRPLPAAQPMESLPAVTRRELLAELRYVGESRAIRRVSTGTATASPANHGGTVDKGW